MITALAVVSVIVDNMKIIKESNKAWQSGMAKNITFIVTKDCQLACKYCYLIGKNSKERMSWDVAKQAIDYILNNEIFLERNRSYGILLVVNLFWR